MDPTKQLHSGISETARPLAAPSLRSGLLETGQWPLDSLRPEEAPGGLGAALSLSRQGQPPPLRKPRTTGHLPLKTPPGLHGPTSDLPFSCYSASDTARTPAFSDWTHPFLFTALPKDAHLKCP